MRRVGASWRPAKSEATLDIEKIGHSSASTEKGRLFFGRWAEPTHLAVHQRVWLTPTQVTQMCQTQKQTKHMAATSLASPGGPRRRRPERRRKKTDVSLDNLFDRQNQADFDSQTDSLLTAVRANGWGDLLQLYHAIVAKKETHLCA